jgi:hypothetical protein
MQRTGRLGLIKRTTAGRPTGVTKYKTGKCTSGRHPMQEGEPRCRECRAERDKARRARTGSVTALGAVLANSLPPKGVLDGAACGPATAKMFDPITRGEQLGGAYPSTVQRVEDAKAICAACPVRAACLTDAYAHRRVGVFGGVYVSPAMHTKGTIEIREAISA